LRTPLIASLLLATSMVAVNAQSLADDHDNHQYVHHEEWRKGAKMRDEDWKRGEHIDYKERHLRAPPHGYEWRQVDATTFSRRWPRE